MIDERFDELRDGGNLPSPSGVGLRILELTRTDEYQIQDLVGLIQSDPALTAQILRISNSSAYASNESVTTVRDAAMRLGATSVRTVALGFTLITANNSGVCENFDYDGYWAWSLACAAACQRLANHAKWDPAEAFTCGLLSHIGMLALASVHPESYSRLLGRVHWDERSKLLREETRAFHIDHIEASASMILEWGMPKEFADVVRVLRQTHISDSDEDELSPRIKVMMCADQLASCCLSEDGFGSEGWVPSPVLQSLTDSLSISREELLSISMSLKQEWDTWIVSLSLNPDARRRIPPGVSGEMPADRVTHSTGSGATPDGAKPSTTVNRIQVLVADDDLRQQRLLTHFLDDDQFEVRTVSDGQEALRLAIEWSPDIVITDWMMPEMTGVELCRALRQTEAGRSMYVLILTAREDEDRIVEAFKAGVDDYITKPFNPRILMARVGAGKRLIEMQRLVDEDKHHRMKQVAEMGRLTRKLRAAALTDSLTELPNRRYAMRRLEEEWKNARRTGRPLSCVMIDIDHFKRVNDVFGHDVGDAVLRETAAALRSRTRLGDVVCRLGGEEFLVIGVNCDLSSAMQCAERLRSAVESNHVDWCSYDDNVTISLGVAQMTSEMDNIDQLIKASDEAVFDAKDGGRNRVATRMMLGGTQADSA